MPIAVEVDGSWSVTETAAPAKSRIPETYSNHRTSGLNADVTDDPSKNNFTFSLEGEAAGPAGKGARRPTAG